MAETSGLTVKNMLFMDEALLLSIGKPGRSRLCSENKQVMSQIANNTPEQALLGDFPKAIDNAVMDSSDAHNNQMMQLLSDPEKARGFARVVFDLLKLTE